MDYSSLLAVVKPYLPDDTDSSHDQNLKDLLLRLRITKLEYMCSKSFTKVMKARCTRPVFRRDGVQAQILDLSFLGALELISRANFR